MQPAGSGLPDGYDDSMDGLQMDSVVQKSEDCLFLNIWVPHPRKERQAVMVCFLHVLVVYSHYILSLYHKWILCPFRTNCGPFFIIPKPIKSID